MGKTRICPIYELKTDYSETKLSRVLNLKTQMAGTAGWTQLKNKLSNETKSFLIAMKQNTKPEHSCAGPLSCKATSPQLRWIREMCCHCCGLNIGMEVLTGGSLLRAVRETLGGLLSGFCLLATVDLS